MVKARRAAPHRTQARPPSAACSSFMPPWSRAFAVAAACSWSVSAAAAAPGSRDRPESYDWPRGAEVRAALRQGDLFVTARVNPQDAAAGACLPWLTIGPLAAAGLVRLASDPLGFTAFSAAFQERTGLALDASLHSSRRGVLVMPLPGLVGVFARQGADGTSLGSFACVPLGVGAWADALLQQSRPPARTPGDDWYLDRSPSPGGEVTHALARLVMDAGGLSMCTFAGASSAAWAASGCAAGLRLRGRLPAAEAAFVACAVTPGYRSPDGSGTTGQSLVGAELRLGDQRAGTLEAAWSLMVDRPSPAPGLALPTRTRVTLAWSRGADPGFDLPCWLVVEGSKEVSRDALGVREEVARFGSAISLGDRGVQARASFGLSQEGSRLGGEVTLLPSTRLRIGLQARADHLGADTPRASLQATLALGPLHERHELEIGLAELPLSGPVDLASCVRLTLRTTIRVP